MKQARLCLALIVFSNGLGSALAGEPAQAPSTTTEESVSPYEWVGPVTPALISIAGHLRESRRAQPDGMGALVRGIVESPVGTIDGCLEILAQGRVPRALPDDAPQKLSKPQRELLLSAIEQMPTKEVRAALEALIERVRDEQHALAIVDVLGAVGMGRDVAHLAGFLWRDDEHALTRSSKVALRTAYAKILARDPESFEAFLPVLKGKDEVIAQQALMALADRGEPRGLGPCYELARSRPTLAQTAVALMPRFAGSTDVELRIEITAWLSSSTDPARVEWTRALYGALAAFDEGESVWQLVEALEISELPLRSAAHAALRQITGEDLPPDAARWRAWYEREKAWFDGGRSRAATRLASTDPAEVTEALREYSEHRLFRSALSADVLPLLARHEPALRELACRALGAWKSKSVVQDLRFLAEDPHPLVAQAAREALASIEGRGRKPGPQAPSPGPSSDA